MRGADSTRLTLGASSPRLDNCAQQHDAAVAPQQGDATALGLGMLNSTARPSRTITSKTKHGPNFLH
ncbi:MAG TPA: hypothetical protein VJ608_07985, partial [Albitalea sp.]|nr:hypothetical protein [Albitalea sp.]